VHDINEAEPLAAQIDPGALLADKGYDADSFIDCLEARGIKAVIPQKSNRKVQRECDYALYRERILAENFFKTIRHFRGIATRCEKTASNFLARVHLVCAMVWLK
jgi:transposase